MVFVHNTVQNLILQKSILRINNQFLDILYDELSVREHLKLVAEVGNYRVKRFVKYNEHVFSFPKLRQMRRKQVEESIDAILNLIRLVDHEHTRAKNLSGGMKRRLSIGISLIGDPKVIQTFKNIFSHHSYENECL